MSNPHIILKNTEPTKIVTGSRALMDLLVRRCAEVLSRDYPAHAWHLRAADHSAVQIRAMDVDTQYGVTLHTTTIQADPELKCVSRAGGEILERARLSRARNAPDVTATHLDLTGASRVRSADKHRTLTRVR